MWIKKYRDFDYQLYSFCYDKLIYGFGFKTLLIKINLHCNNIFEDHYYTDFEYNNLKLMKFDNKIIRLYHICG